MDLYIYIYIYIYIFFFFKFIYWSYRRIELIMVCLDTAYYWKYSNKINFKCINSVVRPNFKAKFTFGSRKQYTRPRKKYQMPNVAADVQSKLSFISLSDCVSFPFINHSNKTWWMRLNVPTWKKKKKKKWWQGRDWLSFDDSDSIYLMGICYEEATCGHFLFLTSYIISRLVQY